MKYLWISLLLLLSIGLKSSEKILTTPFNPFLLILLIIKPFETSLKHNE